MKEKNRKKTTASGRSNKETQKPGNGQQPTSTGEIPGGFYLTAEQVERLIASAKYKQHPYGQCWQPFDLETFNQLVGNIDLRGLDQVILLYKGMILDGWHRYLACLATKLEPKFEEFKGTDLEAAEKVHASGIRRHSQPDQLYASFLRLCEACSDFKEKYEQLRQKVMKTRRYPDVTKDGTPLSTGGQRVDLLGAKATAAGVSRSTAAKVEKVKKANPKAIPEIAAGKTTANKELKKIKEGKESGKRSSDKPKEDRPTVAELVEIVHRGLGKAEEAEQLSLKGNAVYFRVNGHQVKVICKII